MYFIFSRINVNPNLKSFVCEKRAFDLYCLNIRCLQGKIMFKRHFDKIIHHRYFYIIVLLFWFCMTYPIMLNHTPWFDESHAWMLAKWLNWDNWLDIIRAEGHPIIWFLLLKPFTIFDSFYPYPMLILNYLFCLSALCVMWKKAPFSSILKFIITFSSLFLYYYPIIARNYSIGILGLFLLSAFYKEQLKKPVLYSLLT